MIITKEIALQEILNNFKYAHKYLKIIQYFGNANSNICVFAESPVLQHLSSTSNSIFCFDDINFNQTHKSGEVILKILHDLNINKEDIFFDNIYKMPIEQLTNIEKEYHHKLMIKELEILKPKIIICLGNICYSVMSELLKDTSEIQIYKIYHPAYILRNNWKNYNEYLESWRKILKC
jgi:hypothetical protein